MQEPAIFISYRRRDAGGHARTLHEYLSRRFGEDSVFFDQSTIESGDVFPDTLRQGVEGCTVLLALIGPEWLDIRGDGGSRRLDDAGDFVRREIALALKRGKKVIPVLFDNTPVPPRDRLPDPLKALASCDALTLRGKTYEYQIQRRELVRLLAKMPGMPEPLLEPDISRPTRRPAVMHLISTLETIRNGEISALAVAETLAAMAVAVLIAVEFGTLKHIAVSACVAPFLLLRTEKSRKLALDWGDKVAVRIVHIGSSVNYTIVKLNTKINILISRVIRRDYAGFRNIFWNKGFWTICCVVGYIAAMSCIGFQIDNPAFLSEFINQFFDTPIFSLPGPAFAIIISVSLFIIVILFFNLVMVIVRAVAFLIIRIPFAFMMGLVFFFIRAIAILVSLIENPLITLREVPRNWRRVALCIDIVHLPEVLPDMELEEVGIGLEFFKFKRFVKAASEDFKSMIPSNTTAELFFAYMISLMPAIAFWYFPAIAYRWSLKSTALIWSPLLWIVSPATNVLATRLREICRAALYWVMRLYSLVIAVLFFTKLCILWSWHELAETWAGIPVLNAYIVIVPPEIPPWQLAAFVNAVLAWVAFFIADLLLVRYEKHDPLPGDWLYNAFQWVAIVRNTLSLYTIACVLYITVELSLERTWHFPPLGAKLFPWL